MPTCMKEAYDKALAEGKSKAEAYKLAKEAYWKGKYGDRNPTVDIPDAQGMTREQWKDAYRDARLESKPVTDFLRQIHDVEKRINMRIPDVQMAMLMKHQGVYAKLPTQGQRDAHRKAFDQNKKTLRRQWEEATGIKWPRYNSSRRSASGKGFVFKKGWRYDAHEFIPNAYGGPIQWWNIIPVHRDDHQSGIHTEGSVHYLAYPDLY